MIRSIHSVTGHNYVNSRPPPMLNLTDGGHVDNLGILPLIWRKCDVILCSDAGADPELEWWSVCNARHCLRKRTDSLEEMSKES